jgi:hypothetical protein
MFFDVVGLLNILCLSLLHDNWPDGYIYLFIQSNLYWEVIFGAKKKWSYKTGDLLKEVHFIYKIFSERTRKRWPFNTGDCLIGMGRFDCILDYTLIAFYFSMLYRIYYYINTYWAGTMLFKFISLFAFYLSLWYFLYYITWRRGR